MDRFAPLTEEEYIYGETTNASQEDERYTTVSPTVAGPLDGAFNADSLMRKTLAPVEYVVPGVIPEGLTLLVAPPKIGKSWMVLGLGVASATGSKAFGVIPVSARPVLYLALEDGQRRLQSRLQAIGVEEGPKDLYFMTDVPSGAIPTIAAFLERHGPRKPMVILDTLGKVRGTYGGNDAYGNDYGQMSALKDLVDNVPGSSLIVVHHTNKGEKGDFLDSVSGTQGLAGAADSILLIRRERQTESSTLHVTSRDAKEGEYSMTLDDGEWKLDGASLKEANEAVQNRASTDGVGDDMAKLVAQVNKYPQGTRAAELVTMLGWERAKVDTYLKRAYDSMRVERLERGLYTPVRSVRSVRSEESDRSQPSLSHTSNTSNTPTGGSAEACPLHPEPKPDVCYTCDQTLATSAA